MSNLTKYSNLSTVTKSQQECYKSLTAIELSAVNASVEIKIRNENKLTIAKEVNKIIAEGYLNLGQKIPQGLDLEVIHNALMKGLEINFANYTLKEIANAVYLGTTGEFKKEGEVLTMAPVQIFSYIRSYNEKIRKEAIAKMEKQEPEPVVDKEQIQKDWIAETIVKPWSENKPLDDRFGLIYDLFVKNGILSPSNERKVEAYTKTSQYIKTITSKANLPKNEWHLIDEYRRQDFEKKTIEEKKRNKFYLDAVKKAKSEMIHEYIEELRNIDIDLINILKQKKII